MSAIRLALALGSGHHLFVIGPHGVGKHTLVRRLLEREGRLDPRASDWCYVHDSAQPLQPRALRVRAGTAQRLRDDLRRSLEAIHAMLVAAKLGRDVERSKIAAMVQPIFAVGLAAHRGVPEVAAFLAEVEQSVVSTIVDVAANRVDPHELGLRHDVNVIVSHDGSVPIIEEANPTRANLVGRLEYEPFRGMLVTNFHHVRPGALHRANGGYLLLDAAQLVHAPGAWEALDRAIVTRELRMEPPEAGGAPIQSLAPRPIPLDVTIVLFGDAGLYDAMLALDPSIADRFRVAEVAAEIDRDSASERRLAARIATLASERGLLPVAREALACMVEQASRRTGDARRLSLHHPSLLAILEEANTVARAAVHPAIEALDIERAIADDDHRASRAREHVIDATARGTLVLATEGTAIGQINALSVFANAGRTFGLPLRVTARTRLGNGELIDIEREVELGGPIHSKGVLILSGFLSGRYGQRVPLAMGATLVLEQSYGGVEGDSASLAELCALLSAIGELPMSQAFAITGSVDQHGVVQPVGGLHEKIEMFFDVCRAREHAGACGVIIPRLNVQHLMLRRDVVDAVAAGTFEIHAVDHVDDAMELLAHREIGECDADGAYPPDSINGLLIAHLARFAQDARRFMHEPPARRRSSQGMVLARPPVMNETTTRDEKEGLS